MIRLAAILADRVLTTLYPIRHYHVPLELASTATTPTPPGMRPGGAGHPTK